MNYVELMDIELPIAAAVIRLGDDWFIERANEEFARLVGYSKGELVNLSGDALILKRDRYLMEETLEQAVRMHKISDQEVRIVRPDREVRWVEVRCNLMNYVDAIPRLILFMWDIDEKKSSSLEQTLLNKRYEAMENMSKEYPFDVDVVNRTILKSHRFAQKLGENETQDVFCPIESILSYIKPQDQEVFNETIQEASCGEKTGSFDVRFNITPGEKEAKYVWFRTFYRSVANDEGKIIRIIGRSFNVDEDKALLEEVKRDPLTKLLNKVEVMQRVEHYLEENTKGSHAMLLIDIDNFKGVNDNFGHTFGDTVIIEVAEAVKSQFREMDVVGRVGGDEFLVFMKNTSLEQAAERAERLCALLNKNYSGKQVEYHISCSVGISMYPVDGRTYSALFDKADHAMYRIKQSGKNGFEIANASDTGQIQRMTKSVDRRTMLSQEDREFLGFAVSVMTHAKNPEASMNMLLKRIADRYDLNYVAVLEDDIDNLTARMTNYYHATAILPENLEIKMTDEEIIRLPVDACMIAEGSKIAPLETVCKKDHFSESLELKEDMSAVVCRFQYAQDRQGTILYSAQQPDKHWTQAELDVLQELTRTISIFITLRFRLFESRRQIRHLQRRDTLTNLYNQDAFRQVVSGIVKKKPEGQILALEYFDINNFGYVNENYGYKVGDNILKMLAEDIQSQPYFVAGCRLYSDYFLILIQGENQEKLEEYIQNRSRRFSNMQNHRYPNSGMGITVGLYIIEPEQFDVEQAIENANLAWKSAKKKNKELPEVYDESLRATRAEEQLVIGEFFEALYRDDFQLYLQPKFILGSRNIYGAEALARWKRPDGSVLPPASFIDSLERIGYITELDFYIFEEVLKTIDGWNRRRYRPIVISTNFSGHHFEGDCKEFIRRISHILSKYPVDPGYIEIEVTERVFVENMEGLFKCLQKLREMGFRIAIDDFGTGYSSLSVLADVPADVVKIDKSFVNQDMTEQRRQLLCQIGNMVRILQKDIIVEGVETEEQEQYLKEGGFNQGQGFLCNKPIPVTEFEKLYM